MRRSRARALEPSPGLTPALSSGQMTEPLRVSVSCLSNRSNDPNRGLSTALGTEACLVSAPRWGGCRPDPVCSGWGGGTGRLAENRPEFPGPWAPAGALWGPSPAEQAGSSPSRAQKAGSALVIRYVRIFMLAFGKGRSDQAFMACMQCCRPLGRLLDNRKGA